MTEGESPVSDEEFAAEALAYVRKLKREGRFSDDRHLRERQDVPFADEVVSDHVAEA